MLALLVCQLMATLDASIVNVALPQLSRSLHTEPAQAVWVATAFLLATACAIPGVSALCDQIGQRPLFLIGVSLFTLSSLGCALSPSLAWLIGFRVAQGLGSAAIIAVCVPMYRYLFPPERLGSVMGLNAMFVALGTAAGPTLGGVILAVLDWPWLFLINLPFGALAFILALIALPAPPRRPGHYDAGGGVLAAAAIAAFLLGLHEVDTIGTPWIAGVLLAASAALLVLFARHERRAARPLIPSRIWNGTFSLAVATAWTSFFSQGIAFIALPFLFQSAYGATPLRSALLFTPWPAVIVVVAPLSGWLADRVRPALLALAGLTIFTFGMLLLALLSGRASTASVLVATAVCGLGFAVFQSPNNRDMLAAAPIDLSAAASAVLNTNRMIGQSVGSATVSMALALSGAAAAAASLDQQATAATAALWVAVGAAGLAAVLSGLKLRRVATAHG